MFAVRTISPRRRLIAAGISLVALSALAACGDDDNTASADSDRPQVTFTATDDSISAPAEVPSGLVDITLDTARGEVGHHIFVARMDDGLTFEEAMEDDEAFFPKMTIKGGNGTIAAGEDALMTLDPAKGTVVMGPGMVIDIPDDFDGRGVWEFVNRDEAEVHEAAMVKQAAGKTADDVVEWFHGDMSTPPPIDGEFGSMGAIGPGQRAWMTLEPGEPGDYVVICFIPGRDGIPHIAKGMITPFTVTSS